MKEYFYDIDLAWVSDKTAVVKAYNMPELEVGTPLVSPRESKDKWTPEHLLAASVSSAFMATYLGICDIAGVEISSYNCQCFLKLEKENGKYKTTEILLRPVISLYNENVFPNAYKCLEDAKRSCPVKNALKINVEIHPHFEFQTRGRAKVG